MTRFFIDSVENQGTSFAHRLETTGNKFLSPLASYSHGKKYAIIGGENHWDSGRDGYRETSINESALRSLSLVPGILMGTLFKGLSYLSKEVRTRNESPLVFQRMEAERSSPYHEVTRRIDNRQELEVKLSSCPEEKVDHLESLLANGDWLSPSLFDPDTPYYALRLLREKRISAVQFGTVQIFCQAIKTYGTNLIVMPLFDRVGEPRPEAKSKVIATAQNTFDMNLIDEYFHCMRQLPRSEQVFFYIEQEENRTIVHEINLATGITALGRVNGGRMIPTIGMMQQFLDVFPEGDPVKINPVIGLSTIGDIRTNGLENTRDMAIPFPGVKLPHKADGFDAPGLDFTYHDFYHALVASAMPEGHRRKMIAVADAIDEQRKHCWRGHGDLTLLRDRFIDMEFATYRMEELSPHFPYHDETLFWLTVAQTEANHELIESTKTHILPRLGYDKKACRRGILESLQPRAQDVKRARDQFIALTESEIENLPPTDQDKKRFLESVKKTHPIHGYVDSR